MSIPVSKPTLDDIPALLELWQAQYEYHNGLDNIYYVPLKYELKKKFEEYLSNAIQKDSPHILIAKNENDLVGFITFTEGEDDYLDAQIKEFGLIIELYVVQSARGKGIGKALTDEAESYFKVRGLHDLKLSCSSFNADTLNFYRHLGYVDRQRVLFKKI